MKSYVPTRVQIEDLARKKYEHEKAALEQRIKELEEQVLEERMVRESLNVETGSQRGSNSRHQMSPRYEELVDEAHHNANGQEDDYAANEEDDPIDENLIDQWNATAPSGHVTNMTTTPRNVTNMTTETRNDGAPRYAHDTLVGKEVILYAMLRSDQPVAKGIITSTNPNTIVGCEPLGKQFCEVIVNLVMRRDAELPRPYDHMESMAGAYMMSIAWPYNRLKVASRPSSNKASNPSQGTKGSVGGARKSVS